MERDGRAGDAAWRLVTMYYSTPSIACFGLESATPTGLATSFNSNQDFQQLFMREQRPHNLRTARSSCDSSSLERSYSPAYRNGCSRPLLSSNATVTIPTHETTPTLIYPSLLIEKSGGRCVDGHDHSARRLPATLTMSSPTLAVVRKTCEELALRWWQTDHFVGLW